MISVFTALHYLNAFCDSGIGKETAHLLSFRRGKIILACKDMEKAEKARGKYTYYRKI
jgi:NAD(P)-dependent dehydrogenase (short-subunit alcohol dehydrogenase family)